MGTISYPLRFDEHIMDVVNLRVTQEYVDKTTALRQLLYKGVEDYVMQLYAEGRISLTAIAELLGKSVHDIIRIADQRNIKIKHDEAIIEKGKKTAEKLFPHQSNKKAILDFCGKGGVDEEKVKDVRKALNRWSKKCA